MQKFPRGSVLMSLLIVVVIVLMLVAAVIKRGESGLFQSSHYRDGVRALQAAKGGSNHLVALLENDNTFEDDLEIALNNASYSATFEPSEPFYSVNNLNSGTPSTQVNFQGAPVAPYSADLVLTGRSGRSTSRVHLVVQQGINSARSVAAVGRVTLTGNVVVDGIKSLTPPENQTEPEPAPGGIFSKYKSTSASEPAISWVDAGGSFELSELSKLEAAPTESPGQPFSSNLRSNFPEQIIEDGAADVIPDIDVVALVSQGMSSSTSLAPGGSSLNGYVYVKEELSVDGDLTVNGTLSLTEGSLYVDGNLTVNGSIEGQGTIYASGNVSVLGGNAVVITDQPVGTAVLAGGNVTLQGVDASGAMESLASTYGFTPAVDRLEQLLSYYADEATVNFRGIAENLGKHDGAWYPDPPGAPPGPDSFRPSSPINEWISPISGPNGMHNFALSNAATARVILSLQESYPGYATDPAALKVIKSLEQLQFFFRSNKHLLKHDGSNFISVDGSQTYHLDEDNQLLRVSGAPLHATDFSPNADFFSPPRDLVVTKAANEVWDDQGFEPGQRTHDWIYAEYGSNMDSHRQRRDAFLQQNNPLDPNWLGESSFQGLVYARGDISADTKFKVVGAMISLGDVDLSNGAELIFNEEYKGLIGTRLPIGLVHYEEL